MIAQTLPTYQIAQKSVLLEAERFFSQLSLSVKNKSLFEFEIESPNGLFKCQNSFLDVFYFLKFRISKKKQFLNCETTMPTFQSDFHRGYVQSSNGKSYNDII